MEGEIAHLEILEMFSIRIVQMKKNADLFHHVHFRCTLVVETEVSIHRIEAARGSIVDTVIRLHPGQQFSEGWSVASPVGIKAADVGSLTHQAIDTISDPTV